MEAGLEWRRRILLWEKEGGEGLSIFCKVKEGWRRMRKSREDEQEWKEKEDEQEVASAERRRRRRMRPLGLTLVEDNVTQMSARWKANKRAAFLAAGRTKENKKNLIQLPTKSTLKANVAKTYTGMMLKRDGDVDEQWWARLTKDGAWHWDIDIKK